MLIGFSKLKVRSSLPKIGILLMNKGRKYHNKRKGLMSLTVKSQQFIPMRKSITNFGENCWNNSQIGANIYHSTVNRSTIRLKSNQN